jgi:hypothetical protein
MHRQVTPLWELAGDEAAYLVGVDRAALRCGAQIRDVVGYAAQCRPSLRTKMVRRSTALPRVSRT